MPTEPTRIPYVETLRALGSEAENGSAELVVVTGRAAGAVEYGHPERVAKIAVSRVFTAKNRRELDAFLAGVSAGMNGGSHVRLLSPTERKIILEDRP